MNTVRQYPRSRAGKTIIEMMVVIATSAVLVSLAAGLFHHLSRTERLFRDSVASSRAQIRLAGDFRADVRTAETATLIKQENGESIQLKSNHGTILYTPTPDGLSRQAQRKETPHRDEYRLGDVAIQFTIADGLATMTVTPLRLPPPARPRSSGPFRIVAAIAADRVPDSPPPSNKGESTPVIAPRPSEATP